VTSELREGVALQALSGTIQNDILKEYVARGTYIYPPRPALRIVTDIFAYCERELPNWNTISISGYHIREAGSTSVQEVAFTFAHAIAYVQSAVEAGLDVNGFGERLSFFFNAHNDFLDEIAKFRAARRLWARLMRDRFHATNPRAQQLRFHTQTAGSTLTAQQPDNNIVRVALRRWRRFGGTQSLHGHDEALRSRPRSRARVAHAADHHRKHVANTVDRWPGLSYRGAPTKSSRAPRISSRIDRWRHACRDRERLAQIRSRLPRAGRLRHSGELVLVASTGSKGLTRRSPAPLRRRSPIFSVNPDVEPRQIERLRHSRDQRRSVADGDRGWSGRQRRSNLCRRFAAVEAQPRSAIFDARTVSANRDGDNLNCRCRVKIAD
jgi:methylmalonyl-CoA mutase N-terminal domain/subunit